MPRPGAVGATVAAFLCFILVSTIWAEAGGRALPKLLAVTAILAAPFFLWQRAMASSPAAALGAARGLAVGIIVGLAFLLIELTTGQGLQIAIYNLLRLPAEWMQPMRHFTWQGETLVAIEPAHINRNLAVAALLAIPAALAATPTTSGARSRISGPGRIGQTMHCAA
ncbi:MAG: hypothetical protein ACT4N2_07755, partial [Hyphomicrobium sp.]